MCLSWPPHLISSAQAAACCWRPLPFCSYIVTPQVVGVWALSQLTHMQMAELLIACWPYFAYLPALVELSPFLTPDDSPQVTINASVSETAAAAAALADEVGYTGAGAFMRKRGDAMEAQLQFVLQHIQGL